MKDALHDLVASLQVGTRNLPPPRTTDFPLEGTERAMLAELGMVGLQARAGVVGTSAVPLSAAPPETARIAVTATDPLEEALDDSLPAALEWARHAAKRGVVAPPSTVARIVPLARKNPEFRPVLGTRGYWLAGVMGIEFDEPPQLSSAEEWETLDPKERARLIESCPDDLPLFEKALKDRRKEVREAAADRLIRLAGSPQAQELFRMASAAIGIERGLLRSKMIVQTPNPESVPKWLPSTLGPTGIGPGAMALFNVVSHVPPSLWGEPAERLLDLSKSTEYADVLNFAWQAAATRFKDQSWMDVLLARMKGGPLANYGVIAGASEAAFDRSILDRLRSRPVDLPDVAQILTHRDVPFSPAVSRAFVEAIARAGQNGAASHYSLYYILPPLAMRLDPSVLPLVEAGLGEPLHRIQEGWLRLLNLRNKLLKSLE